MKMEFVHDSINPKRKTQSVTILIPSKIIPIFSPDSEPASPSPTAPPSNSSSCRKLLRQMSKYPHYSNIIGGMTLLTFDGRTDEAKFSFLSLPVFAFTLQTLSGIILGVQHLGYGDNSLSIVSFLFLKEEKTDADRFLETVMPLISAGGQGLLRLVYLILFKRFLEFHRKLTETSCRIAGDKQSYLDAFRKVRKWAERAIKISFGYSVVIMSTMGGIYLLIRFLDKSRDDFGNFSPELDFSGGLESVLSWIGSTVMIGLADAAYGVFLLHAVWFSLYIKWLGALFAILGKKSEDVLKAKKAPSKPEVESLFQELDEAEELVVEFNLLFQIPIMGWLLSNSCMAITQLFFFLSWIQQGFFQQAIIFLLPLVIQLAALLLFSIVGSTFIQDVEEGTGAFCRNLMRLRLRDDGDELELHDKVVLLNQKLEANPVSICPGYFFTLDRKMITSVS